MPTYTYQYGANPTIDYPRLIIADTDVVNNPVFADEEILMAGQIDTIAVFPMVGPAGFSRTFGTPSPRRVAATLLDSLASNTSRLAAVLKVLDVQMDSSKAADQLRAQAKALRDIELNSGAFAIVEMSYNDFTDRERVEKQFLRLFAS